MNLNELLKKAIKEKKDLPDKNINIKKIQLIISLGIRIVLIYIFFILLVGQYLANIFGFENFYFISILLGTLANIYIIVDVFKKFLAK